MSADTPLQNATEPSSDPDALRAHARWLLNNTDFLGEPGMELDAQWLLAAAAEIEWLRAALDRIKRLPDTPSDDLWTAVNIAWEALADV
jgi:hypothetical protein